MRVFLAGFLLWASMGTAVAKEIAIIADDQHYSDLVAVLDAALKGQGTNILPQVNRVIEMLNKASTVIDKSPSTPSKSDPPKADSAPNKGVEHKD